jgi:hypothetical protein
MLTQRRPTSVPKTDHGPLAADRHSSHLLFLSIALSLPPAAWVLFLALNAGTVPVNDYWLILGKFYSIHGFSTAPGDWLSRHFGHLMPMSYLLYAANVVLTAGSNLGQTLLTVAFALITLVILVRLLPLQMISSLWLRCLVLASPAYFVFTPVAAQNWIMGFSGVHWIGAHTFAMASITCLNSRARLDDWRWVAGGLLLAALASLTYPIALAVWPVWFVGLLRAGIPRPLRLVGVTAGLAVVGWSLMGAELSQGAALTRDNPTSFLMYFLTLLGGIFTKQVEVAACLGLVALAASSCICFYVWRREETRDRLWLWTMIQAYAAMGALITAGGRASFGVEQAVASRYATIPAFLWLALIVMLAVWISQRTPRRRQWHGALILLTFGMIACMFRVGSTYTSVLLARASLQPAVGLSIQLGITDGEAISLSVTPWPWSFVGLVPVLEARRHAPFDKPVARCPGLGKAIDARERLATSEEIGELGGVSRIGRGDVRAWGWVSDDLGGDGCIVLVDQVDRVRGFGVRIERLPQEAAQRGGLAPSTGWVAYAPGIAEDHVLAALAETADGTWRLLGEAKPLARLSAPPSPHFSTIRDLPTWYRAGTFLSEGLRKRFGAGPRFPRGFAPQGE